MALCVNEAKIKMKDFFKVCCKNDMTFTNICIQCTLKHIL